MLTRTQFEFWIFIGTSLVATGAWSEALKTLLQALR